MIGLTSQSWASENENLSNIFIGCAVLKYCPQNLQTGIDQKMIALMLQSSEQLKTSCERYENALEAYKANLPTIGDKLESEGKKTCLSSVSLN